MLATWDIPAAMAYRSAGRTAYTVPAEQSGPVRQTPYLVLREVAAFWWYYLRVAAFRSAD